VILASLVSLTCVGVVVILERFSTGRFFPMNQRVFVLCYFVMLLLTCWLKYSLNSIQVEGVAACLLVQTIHKVQCKFGESCNAYVPYQ
jgi:hypothetical protein